MSNKSHIEVALEIVFLSENAMLVSDGVIEEWLPYSLCLDEDGDDVSQESYNKNSTVTVQIQEWKAKQMGLI
jgi:hypothetical protein